MTEHSQDDVARALLHQEGAQGLGELFDQHRDRLRRALTCRLNPQLQGRVDPSDVIQETFVEAQNRLDDYLKDPKMSPWLWIRFLALQRLQINYRHHVQTKQRDARREVSLAKASYPAASSVHLASVLAGNCETPSERLRHQEQKLRLEEALEQMNPTDREILALRHFEQLSNQEVSEVLGLNVGATSQRYYRALKKLKELLALSGSSES